MALPTPIRAMVLQGDGKILIGGDFTTYDGVTRNRIARLNSDGTLDPSFGNGLAGASIWVLFVAVQPDGKVLIGGDFHMVQGVARIGAPVILQDFQKLHLS